MDNLFKLLPNCKTTLMNEHAQEKFQQTIDSILEKYVMVNQIFVKLDNVPKTTPKTKFSTTPNEDVTSLKIKELIYVKKEYPPTNE
jgi:uncharacterized protein YfkK (UPF0435 family)